MYNSIYTDQSHKCMQVEHTIFVTTQMTVPIISKI